MGLPNRLRKFITGKAEYPFNSEMSGWDYVFNQTLCTLFKFRDIVKTEDGVQSLYLRRWYLWRKGAGKTRYNGAYFLHNIRRSDNDRDPHDHPWDFTTFIIAGGYLELIGRPFTTTEGQRLVHARLVRPGMKLRNPQSTPTWLRSLLHARPGRW